MAAYGGSTPPRTRIPFGAALAALVAAMVMLSGPSAPAGASSTRVMTLALTGGGRLDVRAGDSVTFQVSTGVDQVTASLPGGAGGVLSGGASSTVRLDAPGTYVVSWTVQKLVTKLVQVGLLTKTVTALTTIATCAATVVVAPVVAKASAVVSKVRSAVPKVHVSVSVPRVGASARVGGTPAAPSAGSARPRAANKATTTGSGRAGGPTTTATVGNTGYSSAPGVVAPAAGTGGNTGAADGAGGGFANDLAGGSRYLPVSMNQPGSSAAKAAHHDAGVASQFGSARLPVLLAIIAMIALTGVTVGYARFYVFGRRD